MLEFNYRGKCYVSAPEENCCKGCAFIRDGTGCDMSQDVAECTNIIWVKKASEPVVQDVPKDKQVEYSFEDKLRELLHQEASKGRLVESISVRARTMDGKPTIMHIEYESHGA